ncbi:ABC transporter substrate-binding protein [Marinobacterium rhizophilum]|uniref:ABC transporter substrate-binding protein n=1 Tax=Marinobacterium rhizophilum TaxID=420402 RepID=A0ABY5HGZ5_9GAMM|nr:ABC transporter substrate-binding protein [Marinobacterium rhizophilum]UTW11640.1 ABC transporter substrate-binding protein [Marinobacterium rhizophilum]
MLTPNLKRGLAVLALTLPQLSLAAEKLVLYTSQPNTDAQQTVDAFTAANPDIEVEWVRDGTTKLMAKLRAELSAGVVKPDVLLIADSVTMEALEAEGRLQAYQSPERSAYAPALYDEEGYYYGTKQITTGIVYNTGAELQPGRWADLGQSQYKGQVAMPSPLYSGAALIHLAMITATPDLGWEHYGQLSANETMAQGGNGGVLKAVASGTKPYGVIVDFLAIREAAKGAPLKFVFPAEGSSLVTEPVAIMQGAKNPAAAKKFVDFVLSSDGQQLVAQQGYLPARNDVDAPAGFPARDQIRLLPFDAAKALKDAEANKRRFSELFGG